MGQWEISLVKVGISARGTGLADMVSDSRYPQAVAGPLSVSAGRFSAGIGIYRFAAGFWSFGVGL